MSGQTINVISAPNASDADAATYTINTDTYGSVYPDNIVFSDGVVQVQLRGGEFGDGFLGSEVTNFIYDGKDLFLDGRGGQGGVLAEIPFSDQSPDQGTHLQVSRIQGVLYVTEGALHQPAGAISIPGNAVAPTPPAPPVVQPPAPQVVAIHDNTTGADLPDTSSAYTGPVAGVASQFINITPDNLNVTAKADNLFIKTGSGNDAVALHGGTNVVDAGGGSNFLTSGGGFDTFFLDALNIPAATSAAGPVPGAIWDTIQNFGHGDAATIFGIGPGTALAWQPNEGAVGHTGLTLHAITPNGATTSLTLAGVADRSHLGLSYGQTGGASYLYVKAV